MKTIITTIIAVVSIMSFNANAFQSEYTCIDVNGKWKNAEITVKQLNKQTGKLEITYKNGTRDINIPLSFEKMDTMHGKTVQFWTYNWPSSKAAIKMIITKTEVVGVLVYSKKGKQTVRKCY